MSIGTMLALLTFLLYSVADAIVKSLGGRLDVVEISFFTTIFALVPTVLLKPREESWREVFKLLHPVLMNVRCLAAYAGGLCGTFAFLTIPLAEAYSLIFLTPVFVVLLSAPIFGERINWPRWVVLAMSFAGVLLVVRPGFRVFEIGHVAAICCALLGAINTMLVKQLAPRERRISLMLLPAIYALGFNGVLMLWHFTPPSVLELASLAAIGFCSGTATLIFIVAARLAPVSRISLAQYSQIVWGGLLGAVFYLEFPDTLALAGMLLVLLAGLANAISAAADERLRPA